MRGLALCRRVYCSSRLPRSHWISKTSSSFSANSFSSLPATNATHPGEEHAYSEWLYDDYIWKNRVDEVVSNDALVALVKQEKYGAADRMRLQLIESAIDIIPHPVFEKAALAGLHWQLKHPHGGYGLAQFYIWLRLIPGINDMAPILSPSMESGATFPFAEIANLLIRSGSPSLHLNLIMHFALICASKGYAGAIFNDIVRILVSSAKAHVGRGFLLRMEDTIARYERRHHPERVEVVMKQYRTSIIEICCHAEWLDVAVEIATLERQFTLPERTYEFLLLKLRDQKEMQFSAIQTIENLRSRDRLRQVSTNPVSSHDDGFVPSTPILVKIRPPPAHSLGTNRKSKVVPTRASVALELRALKRILKSRDVQSEDALLRLMTRYSLVAKSTPAIPFLRKIVLDSESYNAYPWLMAEMKFWKSTHEYGKIAVLFDRYFRCGMLPITFNHTLKRYLNSTQSQRNKQGEESGNGYNRPQIRIHGLDTFIIISAIIRLSVKLPWPLVTLAALRASFLKMCSQRHLIGSTDAFTSLIWAFGESGRTNQAAMVLKDMQDLGKQPDRRHYDTLAGVYARAGKEALVMEVFEMLEATGPAVVGARKNKMYPRYSTYGKVIQGFVDARLLKSALVFERRMEEKNISVRGVNVKLDQTLKALRRLEAEES